MVRKTMDGNRLKKLILILFFGLMVFPLAVAGQQSSVGSGDQSSSEIPNPLKADDFTELFVGIANWIAGIIASLAVLVIVYGGFQYMVSGGNEDKIAQARKTIQWAIIGLIIVVMSWSLLKTVLSILGI